MQPPVDLSVIPAPASVRATGGAGFTLARSTRIVTPPGSPAVARIGAYLAAALRRSTGYPLPVQSAGGPRERRGILLETGGDRQLGDEGYELEATGAAVTLRALHPEGLFRGVQTLRQLLPAAIEAPTVQRGPWRVPAVRIVDRPRFVWRGAALDVARHFFSVDEVKRYIDLLALYKINRLHLHLADDQGWRIEIKAWPELTARGGRSEVGGGTGGYYTQQQYADLVGYAADRFITIVPEIDMPGHTNAGLSSYAELNCSGRAPEPYTGIEVGFSTLCVEKDVTYKFIDDVVREIAGLTPGAYFHAGGDEVKTLTPDQYKQFIGRVQTIVQSHGKQMIGWDEIASATLLPTSIVQHWRPEASRAQLAVSPRLILSPANRVYLDMKYDEQTVLGLRWAGFVSVQKTYDWDPDKDGGVPADKILGIEAPLWTETVATIHDMEFMVFPRIAALADLAWAPASTHDWNAFASRLGAQAPRWTALGVNFYRSPEIQWRGLR